MRKKFILLLFVLIFSIKQEEVVFSEIETVSTQAKIIESYDNTLRHGLRDMKIITPYYIDEGEVFDHRKVVLEATDENGFKIPFTEIRYKWEDKALDTSKKGNSAIALLYWEKDPFTTYRATIKVAYDLILQTQNSTIYQGEIWNPVTNFVRANDEDSNPVYWDDDRIKTNNASIDTNVPGVYYHRYTLKGQNKEVSSTFTVTVKEDQTKAELKDTELHVGQKWDLGSIFKNVVDKDGNPIKPEEIKHVWIDGQETREIDTSKPDKHIVQIAVLNGHNQWVNSNTVAVTVKEDKTSLELNLGDHYIYQGEQWDPKRGVKKATDADGNILSIDEIKHWWGADRPINSNKVGDSNYYFYRVYRKDGSDIYNNVTVHVKEDKTSIETKNSILYVGQKWDPKDNFVNATDEDGKSIPWEDPRITKNGASIDTSKPGEHKIKYTFQGKVKNVDSEFTVTVKEEPFTIKQVPYFDFEDHILVSTNKLVFNKKENPTIEVETPSIEGKDWQLQVELSPFLDKENSKSILKGVSLFIPKGKLESDLETEEPTQYDCQLEANGKASILMHGTKTKGKGRWKNKLATKGITLSIPPENKTGNYESTLHWTLLDVPG